MKIVRSKAINANLHVSFFFFGSICIFLEIPLSNSREGYENGIGTGGRSWEKICLNFIFLKHFVCEIGISKVRRSSKITLRLI